MNLRSYNYHNYFIFVINQANTLNFIGSLLSKVQTRLLIMGFCPCRLWVDFPRLGLCPSIHLEALILLAHPILGKFVSPWRQARVWLPTST